VTSTTKATVKKAQALRRALSPPEVILWSLLRRRPAGLKFRRQHPVGPYVLDFYCPSARLGIEVDGLTHDRGDRPERDEIRDVWLKQQRISVLRIPAREVYDDPEAAFRLIVSTCSESPSTTA
jgi:very-short-patch-repair endonuclease